MSVEVCPSEKVIWYSYVTRDMNMSMSVAGYEVGNGRFFSRVVMVLLMTMVSSVGPTHWFLLMVVSVVDHTRVQYSGASSWGNSAVTEVVGDAMAWTAVGTELAEAELPTTHAPSTKAASARFGLMVSSASDFSTASGVMPLGVVEAGSCFWACSKQRLDDGRIFKNGSGEDWGHQLIV